MTASIEIYVSIYTVLVHFIIARERNALYMCTQYDASTKVKRRSEVSQTPTKKPLISAR
jgi:hypothetical protein